MKSFTLTETTKRSVWEGKFPLCTTVPRIWKERKFLESKLSNWYLPRVLVISRNATIPLKFSSKIYWSLPYQWNQALDRILNPVSNLNPTYSILDLLKTPIISTLLFFSGTEPNICRVRIQCHHNVEGLNHLPCVSPLLSPRCRSTMLPEGRLQIDRQARIEIYDSLNEDHKPSHNFNNQPHWRDKIKVVTKIPQYS